MSEKYKILIIGANGGIGRQSVEIALAAGHLVTAVLRQPANLALTHPNLEIIQGDVMHPETFEKKIGPQDAVISALGVKGGVMGDKPTTLYSQGNANLLRLMKEKGIRRAYFISASAIEISPVMPFFARFAAKYILQKLLRHMYADQREMERLVKISGLDWTIIRPPRLTDKPVTGKYRFSINSFLKNCLSVSRADVAHFMIYNISNKDIIQATIEIGY
ncbi:NAD(P)H-binding protein [Flavitalea sp. BT771]|uniref:NAD(P)-dependent oxidoreductase n=1 Tax=Flavitalea sp. BT771 TaxID=3063329 RepID=UPI0026E1A520|nr:NAD(P)H-binding protein [Flavitalea sp. BT771]MDO6430776.1 NAD(P)H-binding protein [Flavitalea sp. BT771]MDV6219084.1 NAD(P)H-binding protein [Flavitalea sp. BT771]